MKRIKIYPILIFALGFCGFLLPESASASEIRYYNVEASSVLYEPGYDHSAWCIDDDDLTTAWMEGADGHGNGEYVDIYTDPYTVVTGGIIYPGFYQDEDLFYKNNAPKMLYIRAGEQEAYLDVTEYATNYQKNFQGYHFVFDEPLVASDGVVHVVVLTVREGWKYDDTCISELRFEGYLASAGTAPVSANPDPHVSVPVDGGTTLPFADENTPGFYFHPDGLGSDGKGLDEEFSQDPEFLDFAITQRLVSFASTLYRLHTNTDKPVAYSIHNSDVYSYTRAYMLNWYQYLITDSRVVSEGYSHYAYEEDLAEILNELFVNAEPEEDLKIFYNSFAKSKSGELVEMAATGDFGDAGSYYFDDPESVVPAGKRTKLTGRVLEYDPESGSYQYALPYYAYFVQNDKKPSVFQFDELVVGEEDTEIAVG